MAFWKAQALASLKVLLGNPATEYEFIIGGAVALLTAVIVFSRLSKLMSFPLSGSALALAACALAGVAAVATAVVANVYIAPLPFVHSLGGGAWLPYVSGLAGLVLLAAPTLRLTHRSRYAQNVTALLLTAAAVGAALALTHAILSAVAAREKDFERTKARTEAMNEFLGGKK